MRRADRLFRLVQLLRRSRLVTARRIAEELQISERTVYRDIRDLSLSGVPVRGEAGVGYALAHGFDLPPMTFNEEELEALVLGARVVQGYADPALARAADAALAKIEMVLPDAARLKATAGRLLAPRFSPGKGAGPLGLLREALRSRRRVAMDYRDEQGRQTQRQVRPLAVAFWGKTWTLASWCELREGFRSFRLDRIAKAELGRPFADEPGKTLDDYIAWVTSHERDGRKPTGAQPVNDRDRPAGASRRRP